MIILIVRNIRVFDKHVFWFIKWGEGVPKVDTLFFCYAPARSWQLINFIVDKFTIACFLTFLCLILNKNKESRSFLANFLIL